MTRESFLKSLNYHLMVRVNADKRKSVLQDYADFFADGKAMGESDDALCQKFGAPREIARELAISEDKPRILKNVALVFFAVFLLMFLWPAEIAAITAKFYNIIFPIVVIIITIICGTMQRKSISKACQKGVIAACSVAFILFIASYVSLLNLWSIADLIGANNTGDTMFAIYTFVNCVIIAALIMLTLKTSSLPKWTLLLVPAMLTMLLIMGRWTYMLGDVTHPDMLIPTQYLFKMVLYNVPAFLIALLLLFRKGKV